MFESLGLEKSPNDFIYIETRWIGSLEVPQAKKYQAALERLAKSKDDSFPASPIIIFVRFS
jgi:hypothetical protein